MANKTGSYSPGQSMQSIAKLYVQLAAIIASTVAGLVIARLPNKPTFTITTATYVASDVSLSNGSRLDSEFALLEYAVDEELPSGTPLTIWAFSNYKEAHKAYSAVPENGMSLWDVEKSLADLITTRDTGTYSHIAVKAIADAADNSTANSIVCLLLWDGEIGEDLKEFTKQTERLANNRKVAAVVCIGLITDKGIRSQVEKAMQCLGDKLIVCGSHDRSQINQLSDLLKNHVEAIRAGQ